MQVSVEPRMMLVLGLLGLITSLLDSQCVQTLQHLLCAALCPRLHGPEDEKYSLKGALTRVEAGVFEINSVEL